MKTRNCIGNNFFSTCQFYLHWCCCWAAACTAVGIKVQFLSGLGEVEQAAAVPAKDPEEEREAAGATGEAVPEVAKAAQEDKQSQQQAEEPEERVRPARHARQPEPWPAGASAGRRRRERGAHARLRAARRQERRWASSQPQRDGPAIIDAALLLLWQPP